MKTEVIAATGARQQRQGSSAIDRAIELLRAGEVVALPTETVYGLAADALRPDAAVKIFEAKDRPRFDPLIVHLPDTSWLERVANISTVNRKIVDALGQAFWPGPFTMVLPKTALVPEIVTAGLDTVAIRVSANPVFQEVIRVFGKPLAAPSANRFGRISPTTAQHVMDELGGRIPLILDGGPTTHGLESTVVAIQNGEIEILRPGPITDEDIHRGIGFQPMNSGEPIAVRYGGNLPHWTQQGATYVVTFRLTDSLPKHVVEEWERERRDIVANAQQQGRELSNLDRQRLAKLFSDKVEQYLDLGAGECWLRDERIATITRDALLFFNGIRYDLIAWCIMPNHVHVVVHPKAGFDLSGILHSWRSFTATKANQLLRRRGQFWQPESYDHLIRDQADLENQVRYVEENPFKAMLANWRWVSSGIGFQPMIHRQDADATKGLRSPGQLPSHYAPKTPVRLTTDARSFLAKSGQRIGLLAWQPTGHPEQFQAIRLLSEKQDLREAAANLFCHLRELDAAHLDLIVAEPVPNEGLGVAINDRLRRAAQK